MSQILSTFKELAVDSHKLISLVGAGGKTSTMLWLADYFARQNKKVIVSTSTKLYPFTDIPTFFLAKEKNILETIKKSFEQHNIIAIADDYLADLGKLSGISFENITKIYNSELCEHILIEADGAARKTLKAPSAHEPCIPAEMSLCIGLMGLDSLNNTLTEETVHRAAIFSLLTNCKIDEKILFSHLYTLVNHAQGLFKNTPKDCERYVFLNKLDLLLNDLSLTNNSPLTNSSPSISSPLLTNDSLSTNYSSLSASFNELQKETEEKKSLLKQKPSWYLCSAEKKELYLL